MILGMRNMVKAPLNAVQFVIIYNANTMSFIPFL